MSDDLIRQILQSPLDPEDGADGIRWPGVIGALMIGLLLGAAAAMVFRGDGGDTTAQSSTTSSTVFTGERPDGLPPGYTPVPGTQLGIRPELAYSRGTSLYVVLTSAVRSDAPVEDTETFKGGEWTVVGGGFDSAYSIEVTNPLALGDIVVEFPRADATTAQSLRLRPATSLTGEQASEVFPIEGLPASIEGPWAIPLKDGTRAIVDRIEIGPDTGTVVWHLETLQPVRARLHVTIRLPDDPDVPVFVSEHLQPPYPGQLPQRAFPSPTTGGAEVVRRIEPIPDSAGLTALQVNITVAWRDVGDRVVEIPLDGAIFITGS